jgi:tagaturonate reductase
MLLNRAALPQINQQVISVPSESIFHLPERILQFGTGVLLRGLIGYFIDKANGQNIFNGRIVVVKSTLQGDTSLFDKQDGLYTIGVRGIENGRAIEENYINASISRTLNANKEWDQVLQCALNKDLQIIVSNTTEVGIQLVKEHIHGAPPHSYPAKLTALLYERYRAFKGSPEGGMVIIPTELLPDNGTILKKAVLELTRFNGLEKGFGEWLEESNHFCNSLVDRIVPGKPEPEIQAQLNKTLGYTDELMIISETYRLWAIEGNEQVKKILSFYPADEGIIIKPNIDRYRELKLRLLNGTHSLSCGISFLMDHKTVYDSMKDLLNATYIERVMLEEIAPNMPFETDLSETKAFGNKVLDRFRNPFIRHQWINITLQYSSKLRTRCVPVLINYYKKRQAVPPLFALGFAAYICFMKPVEEEKGKYFGVFKGEKYPVQDDRAHYFYELWQNEQQHELVRQVLSDIHFWGYDLTLLQGFQEEVTKKVALISKSGMKHVFNDLVNSETTV